VFESGAILFYLAEKTEKLWLQDLRTKYEVVQWVLRQMVNQGPKLDEVGHFRRLGDSHGEQSYAVRRFTDEANRASTACLVCACATGPISPATSSPALTS
jgi:GST-like protein